MSEQEPPCCFICDRPGSKPYVLFPRVVTVYLCEVHARLRDNKKKGLVREASEVRAAYMLAREQEEANP
jgi:hypothetical protein